jgi:hypothetical protein
MKAKTDELTPIPGLEMVGRGVYLRPRQPYELKDILFKRERDKNRSYYSAEAGQAYSVPEGYEVNDSPPMPADEALNQTFIEESWERFDKQMGVSANLAASNSLFSVDVNANQVGQLHSEEDSYYALRNSFIPFWNVYLPNVTGFPEKTFTIDVPVPFDWDHRAEYERFFDCYGTHYVKRVWVGGKAMLVFTVAKSSQMTKEEIQAGIKASLGGLGSSSAAKNLQENKERLLNNSECTVFGKGGDELKLASLSSLDEASYNDWLKTIKTNPQVIELEVAGIWTLIPDTEKAKALQEAYKVATSFAPISAIFGIDRQIYFLRGNKYICYHLDKGESDKPKLIREILPILSQSEFERPDAAFEGSYLFSSTGEDLSRKIFVFKRNKCIRLDFDTGQVDEPREIAEEWPGVTFDRIDAGLNAGPDSVYFFRGNQYIRYNTLKHRADEGYPELTSKRWVGVSFDRIDAAIYWGNSKVYLFKDNQYVRYDMATYRVDPGYPKFISSSYVEDWKFFE